jgi:hypothetical protein
LAASGVIAPRAASALAPATTLSGPFAEGTVVTIESLGNVAGPRWLDGNTIAGTTALQQTANGFSGARFRLHALGASLYSVECLGDVPGPRWLTANASGAVTLAPADVAWASRWTIAPDGAGAFTVQSAAPMARPFLDGHTGDGTTGLAPATTGGFTGAHWQLHAETATAAAPIAHGDVIGLYNLGALDGRRWLDGYTTSAGAGLAQDNAQPAFSGTRWRAHDAGDGTFRFECLGNVPGSAWLNVANGAPNLAATTDRGAAARWQVIPDGTGNVTLRNVDAGGANVWLDGHTLDGTLGLAPQTTGGFSGTHWRVVRESSSSPVVDGRWSPAVTMPVTGIHTTVLPSGKVLTWSRYVDPNDMGSTTEGVPTGGVGQYVWDPRDGSMVATPNAPSDAFCSGHTLLADGRVFVNGGHVTSYVGTKATQIFDPLAGGGAGAWTTSPAWDMTNGRWYPTTITLATGDVLTLSGDATSQTDVNKVPQVWMTASAQWRDLANLSNACMNGGTAPCLPLYPWLHSAPNGRVFVSGPGQVTGYIDPTGSGAWTFVANTNQGYRGDYEGTSVEYQDGQVLIAGGYPSTATAEVIDLNAATPQWTSVAPMTWPRHKLTSTILADGTVFISGGLSGGQSTDTTAVFGSEIWDPATRAFTPVDHMQTPRLYHATAVLLPDGRVLSMGGGLGAGYPTHKNLEVYSPPYLFRGDRPTITAAPAAVAYGATFAVTTPNTARIQRVNLVRLSSDTHSFNSNQRFVPLAFTARAAGDGLDVTAPASALTAPPGHYMLFLVNDQGVPSVASIVPIGG